MIGYYAHSHGSGHCNYAAIFANVFGQDLTVFTDRDHDFGPGVETVRLGNEDTDGSEFDRDRFPEPRALHYAPVNMQKVARRNRTILENIIERDIRLIVIDVSVEVAMLARVSSIPYAYVRLPGKRDDVAHLNAYEGASFLLAYFPESMESPSTPQWVRDKTVYLGFFSRFSFDIGPAERPAAYGTGTRPVLLYIKGFGGSSEIDLNGLGRDFNMYGIGPGGVRRKASSLRHIGVVDCTRAYIRHADVIVASCGLNVTSEILTLGKRFVAVPEDRPYGEQVCMGKNLERSGLAIDSSRYTGLAGAVKALIDLGADLDIDLPNRLTAFRDSLKFHGFRADRFLQAQGTLSETVPVNPVRDEGVPA